MIFERIILENVGVYAGRNVLELQSTSAQKPIVLIGGLNGGGKTTLLESIHLCFYGRNAAWSHRGKQPYQSYLRGLINHQANPTEGARIEIHYTRRVDGRPHRYTLARSWRVADEEVIESVMVERNGEIDTVLSDHWEEYIEGYLPSKLANLFFFDGEQIAELAERENAARILSTAVQSLLGLDLVTRLSDDLAVLERRKKMETKSDEERAKIETLRADFEAAEKNTSVVRNEGRALNTDLQRLQQELREWQKRYRKEGGELFDRHEELKAQLSKAQIAAREAQAAVDEILAGPAPFLLVEKLLADVEAQAETELEIRHEKIVAQAEKNRDQKILRELKNQLSERTLAIVAEALEKFRPERIHASDQLYLNPDEEMPEQLRLLMNVVLPGIRESLDAAHRKAESLREDVARLEQQIDQVPDADALAAVRKEIAFREAQIRDTETKLVVQAERQKQAQTLENENCAALEKALGGVADNLELMEANQRILSRVPRVRATLQKFREQVVARHASRLERLILESFHQLLRKSELVHELQINPLTFELELRGPDRRPLPFERLSAGERQLLATAILWGLAKASGRPLPTIIDTPLGRLDSSHRRHLVQRYFPVVSHQVILLSTDEEIDERYRSLLSPSIGRTYRLVFDDRTRSTTIEPGYFEAHEATR